MTDELRHAGIGIDLDIQGFQQLMQMNQEVDKTIQYLKDVVNITQQVGNAMTKMSNESKKDIDKISDSIAIAVAHDREFHKGLDNIQNKMDSMRTSGIDKIGKSFSDSIKPIDDMHKSIDQMQKSINEVKPDNFKTFREESNKTNDTVHETTERVKESGHQFQHFRDTALGTFAGNALQSGVSALTGGLESAVKQGLAFNSASDDIRKQWQQIGLNTGQTDGMINQIASIRQHADISAAAITKMQRQYLTLTGSAADAQKLVSTITSFGKESGMNDQQMSGVNRMISSNGKINARMFQRSFGNSPGFANEIIKESGMSRDAFNKLLQSGKMTGQQLREDMIKASSDANKAWSNYANTTAGRMDMLKLTVANTKKTFDTSLTAGLFNAIKKEAGNGTELNKMQATVNDIAKNVGNTLGKTLGAVVGFITKNIKPLEQAGSAIWQIVKALASGAWGVIADVMKSFSNHSKDASNSIKGVADGLTNLSKHTTAIKALGGALVFAFAASKVYKFGNAIGEGIKTFNTFRKIITDSTKAQAMFNAVADANPFGLIALAIAGVAVAVVELYNHFKPFREFVNGMGKWFSQQFGEAIKWVKGLLNGVGKMVHGAGQFFGSLAKTGVSKFNELRSRVGSAFKGLGTDLHHTADDNVKVHRAELRVFGDLFTGKFGQLKKDVPKVFTDMFDYLKDIGKTAFNFLNKLTGGKLGDMANIFSDAFKDIQKVWNNAWNSIGNFFKGIWNWIEKIVSDGINSVIGVMNSGIKGIDTVISTFGGSNQAIKPISNVKFATGTGVFSNQRRPINKPTFAMLNDGNDSPETNNREMVIHPNGLSELVNGRNTTRMLAPGTEVLNASETKMIMNMSGLTHYANGTGALRNISKAINNNIANDYSNSNSIAHYANGTGALNNVSNATNSKLISNYSNYANNSSIVHYAKGTGLLSGIEKTASNALNGAKHLASEAWHGATSIVNSIKGKLKFVQELIKNPLGYLSTMFHSPKGIKGSVMNEMGSGLFSKGVDTAKNWWSTLAKMISGSLDDGSGSASGLLAAVEKYGRGKKYAWGATGPSEFDCSGLVQYALKTAFGISYPRQSGSQIAAGQHIASSDAKPGDLIGNAGHIGVYAGNGRYWAAASPDATPNIGMWPVSAFPDGQHYFARVPGLADKESKSKKDTGGSTLQKLIKSQTGGMLSWITKHLAPLISGNGTDGNSPNGVMSKADFNKTAQQAAQIMHVTLSGNDLAKLYWQAFDESTVNPAVGGGINDHDGTGLPYGLYQYKQSTWDNYAISGHKNIHSALDQDLAVLNDKNWRNDIAPAGVGNRSGWSPTGGRARKNGGEVKKNHWYQVNEEGFEMFKPKTDGKIINHNESKKIMSSHARAGSNHNITIDAPMTINISGDAKHDANFDRKISNAFNAKLRQLAEKISQELGVDIDEGGMYPL